MFWIAFVFGLLGSFHCVGMCGPIALLLPLQGHSNLTKILKLLLYFTGKTFTYLCLGLLFALVGKGLFIAHYQQFFSIVTGVTMLVVAVAMMLGRSVNFLDKQLYTFVNKLKVLMGDNLRKRTYISTLLMGFFNGFLPCGLVYMALFGALNQVGIPQTMLYMLGFSLGVMPLMIFITFLGNFIGLKVRNMVQKMIPFFVLMVAFLFIIRGLGLGVEYFSPADKSLIISSDPSCTVPMP